MSDRTCAKCGKEFTHPCRLKSHLRRKTPCDPIVSSGDISEEERKKPHVCRFCNRRFSTAPSLNQHIKSSCAITVRSDGMDLLYEHTRRMCLASDPASIERMHRKQEADNAEMMKRLEDLERNLTTMLLCSAAAPPGTSYMGPPYTGPSYTAQSYAAPQHAGGAPPGQPPTCGVSFSGPTSVNTVTQHIVGNGVQINQQVHINVFGEEATSHIGRGKVKAMLDTILGRMKDPSQAALQALLETALMIYSDPDRPENITCYLPARSGSEALVHVGGSGGESWAVRPVHLVLTPMVQRCLDTIVHNQPFDDAKRYGDLMKALVANEQSYNEGGKLKAVLVRNKELRDAALCGKRTLLA